jgi:hypothetical protein
MIPAVADESCDQLKFPAKPSCSAPDSTEATVETLNPSNPSRGLANIREGDVPDCSSSPEKPKSPQRLKKAGLDDPTSPPTPLSETQVNPEVLPKNEDASCSD